MSKAGSNLKRILLPVDLSRDSLEALNIAFDLAAALGGDISALFVEDEKLLAAASLPFAREVGSFSGISRQIGCKDIEHRFRSVADKARVALIHAARKRQIRSSFRVARGDVSEQILTASCDADLIVLGKAGWSAGVHHTPGNTCLEILSGTRIPVLIVEQGASFAPPIVAVNDDTASGLHATEVARRLGEALRWDTTILAARGITRGEDVLERIPQEKPHLIIMPSSLPFSKRGSRLKCPVLFVP
jgi:nucleotide-binding universal stress UspA family protein